MRRSKGPMPAGRTRPARIVATLLAALAVVAAAPPAAWAQDERNIWSRWAEGATKREHRAEIPFALIVSFPAMLVITPFWLVGKGIGMVTGGGDDEDEE